MLARQRFSYRLPLLSSYYYTNHCHEYSALLHGFHGQPRLSRLSLLGHATLMPGWHLLPYNAATNIIIIIIIIFHYATLAHTLQLPLRHCLYHYHTTYWLTIYGCRRYILCQFGIITHFTPASLHAICHTPLLLYCLQYC